MFQVPQTFKQGHLVNHITGLFSPRSPAVVKATACVPTSIKSLTFHDQTCYAPYKF